MPETRTNCKMQLNLSGWKTETSIFNSKNLTDINIKLHSKKLEETKFVILVCYEDWINKKKSGIKVNGLFLVHVSRFSLAEFDLIQ